MLALSVDTGLQVAEVEPPVPGAGEALVRVRTAGICNTDLELARGYMDFRGVLGHELVGQVEACDDEPSWVGRRVAAEINLACGRCPTCLGGLERHCPTRQVLGILGKQGCFAEYVTMPIRNLHALPDTLDDRRAAFIEPSAACFEILEQVHVGAERRVAIVGDGKLALLAGQVLRQRGCEPLIVGKHDDKLKVARACGLRTCTRADLTPKSFDVVVEASGSPTGMSLAVELTRPRGTIVLKSTFHGALTFESAPVVIDEITITGSRCGPFEPAVSALAEDRIRTAPLVDSMFKLEDAISAFERAQQPGVLKVLLDIGGER